MILPDKYRPVKNCRTICTKTLAIAVIIWFFSYPAGNSQSINRTEQLPVIVPKTQIITSENFNSIYLADTIHSILLSRFPQSYGRLNTVSFYRNLQQAAARSFLTQKLHAMLLRQPRELPGGSHSAHRENYFQSFSGKTIRNITIKRLDVFGERIDLEEELTETHFLERIGNRLHIKTSEITIARNLFFQEGDTINHEILSDNERILRGLTNIEDARFYILEDAFIEDVVDIVIMTRDYWSKGFNLQMNEVDAGRIELYDRNIAGRGRELQMNLHFDAGREQELGIEALFNAANIYGTFIDGYINYMNVFGDRLFRVSFDRSFYTPNIKYAGGASFTHVNRKGNFNYPDTVYLNVILRYNSHDYWLARSFPMRKKGKDYLRSGIAISGRLLSNRFFERPPVADNLFYRYHSRNLYLAGVAWTRQRFYRSRFIYRLGQYEDIPTGSIMEAVAGYEDNQFFSRTYLGGRIATGFVSDKTGFLFSSISLGSFINKGVYEQSLLSIQNRWFSPLTPLGKNNFRQFIEIRYVIGANRFEEEYISLSGPGGIRGLRSPEMEERQKLVFNLESVFFSPASILGFRFAWSVFSDFGWIGPETKSVFKGNIYSGIGLGLMIRSELMVFPSLILRLAYFPIIPEGARFDWIFLESDRARQPDVFRLQKPEIYIFR